MRLSLLFPRDWISESRNTAAIVLAKDVVQEFAEASGLKRSLFAAIEGL
jgi:hypothetical protein